MTKTDSSEEVICFFFIQAGQSKTCTRVPGQNLISGAFMPLKMIHDSNPDTHGRGLQY